jgi:hypothetical protein
LVNEFATPVPCEDFIATRCPFNGPVFIQFTYSVQNILTPSNAPSSEPSASALPSAEPSLAPSAEPSVSAAPTGSKKGGKGNKTGRTTTTRNGDGKGKLPSPPLPEGVIIQSITELVNGTPESCPDFVLETPQTTVPDEMVITSGMTGTFTGALIEVSDICSFAKLCGASTVSVGVVGLPSAGSSPSGKGKGKSGDEEETKPCPDVESFTIGDFL